MASMDKLFRVQMGLHDTLNTNAPASTSTIGTLSFTTDTKLIYLDMPANNETGVVRVPMNSAVAALAERATLADNATEANHALTADAWTSAINVYTTDGSHNSTSVTMDGSAAVGIKLPSTINASVTSAGKWTSDGKVFLASSDGTTGKTAAQTLNYSADGITLKLPATIKATFQGNLTGNVTGNVSGTAGSWASPATLGAGTGPVVVTPSRTSLNAGQEVVWNTSIANGQITNAMLAGSIANGKLANSKVTIAGNDVSLGGSLAADTLRTSLGLASALRFVGTIDAMTDITVANPGLGTGYTPAVGDVVLTNNGQEYVYANSKWNLLSDNAQSFKVVQTAVSDPTASGTSTSFIKTISQNANGVITATKASLPTASTSTKGIASFSNTYFAVDSGVVSLSSLGNLNAATATAWKSAVTMYVEDSAGNKGASIALNGNMTGGVAVLKLPTTFSATVTNAELANATVGALSINGKTFDGSEDVTVGTLGVGYGGTGKASWTAHALVCAATANSLGQVALGTAGQVLQSNGTTADPSWVTATNANTASTIVKRDASGNFTAGTITAALSGNATSATAWKDSMTVTISDYSSAHSQATTGFNYASSGKTLKLPATITATLVGTATSWASNASIKIGAANSKTFNAGSEIVFTASEIGSTVVWETWD